MAHFAGLIALCARMGDHKQARVVFWWICSHAQRFDKQRDLRRKAGVLSYLLGLSYLSIEWIWDGLGFSNMQATQLNKVKYNSHAN